MNHLTATDECQTQGKIRYWLVSNSLSLAMPVISKPDIMAPQLKARPPQGPLHSLACPAGTHLRPQPQDQFAASVAHAHIARPVPAAVARRDLSLRASRPDAPQPSMNRRAALVAGTGAAVTAAAGDRQALARITGISKPELVPQEPGVKVQPPTRNART